MEIRDVLRTVTVAYVSVSIMRFNTTRLSKAGLVQADCMMREQIPVSSDARRAVYLCAWKRALLRERQKSIGGNACAFEITRIGAPTRRRPNRKVIYTKDAYISDAKSDRSGTKSRKLRLLARRYGKVR